MVTTEKSGTKRIPKLIGWGLAGIAVLVIGLGWWNGRSAATTTTDHILYLSWEEDELVNQLYLTNPDNNQPIRLTDTADGVISFAVSPDANKVAYSVATEAGTIDIWLMNPDGTNQELLWACQTALCTRPIWASDNRRLMVERRLLSGDGTHPQAPQLWWLDTQTGESLPVFADANQTGFGASLSPDNQWLSYTIPEVQEIRVTHLETGEYISAPSQTGEPAVWHPDGETLMLSDMWFQGESFSQHLFNMNLDTAELINISGEEVTTNDGLPVFSPNGEWVAFGRKKPRAPMGKQLWLMRPDGSEPISITENADMHFNNPAWSPDGTQIVVQGFNQTDPNSFPMLWLVDVETGELEALVSPGIQPVWLP